MSELLGLGLGALVTALLLAVEHWFPYTQPLTLIQKYTMGVAAILAGFSLWRGLLADWLTPLGLLCICIVGGAAVVGSYWFDDHKRRVRQAQAAERSDAELQS